MLAAESAAMSGLHGSASSAARAAPAPGPSPLLPSRWPARRHWRVRTPDDLEISVREWGKDDGLPIVFVHGLAQSHLSFLPQFASPLGERYRLVAHDLRGHGESAKPLDRAYYNEGRRWADELAAVLDSLGN